MTGELSPQDQPNPTLDQSVNQTDIIGAFRQAAMSSGLYGVFPEEYQEERRRRSRLPGTENTNALSVISAYIRENNFSSIFCGEIRDHDTIHDARVLVASEYLHAGYIKPEDRTDEDYIGEELDPYRQYSTYFAKINYGKMAATVRTIRMPELKDFPALKEFKVNPFVVKTLDPNPNLYSEVSALAKEHKFGQREDVLSVYAAAMKDSINHGEKYWFMSVDTKLMKNLKRLFGQKSFTELGPPELFMGSDTQPLLMDIHKALGLLDGKLLPKSVKKVFVDGLRGLDTSNLDDKTIAVLRRNGMIESPDDGNGKERKMSLKDKANIALGAFCVARAGVIPITGLSHQGVNPGIFLGIDLATVYPYTEGISRYVDPNNSKAKRLGGVAMFSSSFAAPYVYAALETTNSKNLRTAVGAWVGMLVGGAAVKKIRKIRQQNRAETEPAEIETITSD